ncbi:MAG: nucleotide sugar dehydrogenase [Desulfurococcaceae archaeon]
MYNSNEMDCVDKLYRGECKVAVYGAGYVGLGIAAVLLRKDLQLILVDVNEEKLSKIANGIVPHIEETVVNEIQRGLMKGLITVTSDSVKASRESCVKIVTVPIYLDWLLKNIDYSAFRSVLMSIAKGLKRGDLVIIESSVPPGTTIEIAKPILEEYSGLRVEHDFYLAYSPERVYVGRIVKDIEENYPKVVGGIGPLSLEIASKFYERICRRGVVRASNTTVAEFEKIAEGIYRDVNIALANQLALACMYLGIDYYEVMSIANTQPYCNLHQPGPGVGGFCIPIYPYFAINKLLEKKYYLDLVVKARSINEAMPHVVVKLIEALYLRNISKLNEVKTAILGVAFRGDIDDSRLSPSHDIIALLKARGIENIVAHDPYVSGDDVLKRLNVELTNNIEYALRDSDLVIVTTRHSIYRKLRISKILEYSGKKPLIMDTVNVLIKDTDYDKFVVLGRGPVFGLSNNM